MNTLFALLAAIFCASMVFAACPDTFGANDVIGAAANLTNCTNNNPCFSGNATDDWFKLYAPAGVSTFTATILYNYTVADIDLRVTDNNGTVLGSSSSTTNNDTVQIVLTGPAWVFVHPFLYSAITGNGTDEYNVTGCFTNVCADAYSPNFSSETAFEVTGVESANQTLTPSYCGNDQYFKFTITTSTNVTVIMILNDTISDLDIALINSAGVTVGASSGTSNQESINYQPTAGVYTVQVHGFSGTDAADFQTYSLSIDAHADTSTTGSSSDVPALAASSIVALAAVAAAL